MLDNSLLKLWNGAIFGKFMLIDSLSKFIFVFLYWHFCIIYEL